MEPLPPKIYEANHITPRMVMCSCGQMIREHLLQSHQATLGHVRTLNSETNLLKTVLICSCNKLVCKSQFRKHLESVKHTKLLQLSQKGLPRCSCGLAFEGPIQLHLNSRDHMENVTALDKYDFEEFVKRYYGHVQQQRESLLVEANTRLMQVNQIFERHINEFVNAKRAERAEEAKNLDLDLTGSLEPCTVCLMRPDNTVCCANESCIALFCRDCAE